MNRGISGILLHLPALSGSRLSKSRHTSAASRTSPNRDSSANMAEMMIRLNIVTMGTHSMSRTDEHKPAAKPRQRNSKPERNRKSAPPKKPMPDRSLAVEEQTGATLAPADTSAISAAAATDARPVETTAAIDTSPVAAAAPAETARVNLRTIANAYGDYTLKSFDEAKSFVEKLTGVRSLDKAVEVQTEFARQAYATFVADSQKIGELHKELTRQMFRPLESLVSRTARPPR
jgi:hypothetical protein